MKTQNKNLLIWLVIMVLGLINAPKAMAGPPTSEVPCRVETDCDCHSIGYCAEYQPHETSVQHDTCCEQLVKRRYQYTWEKCELIASPDAPEGTDCSSLTYWWIPPGGKQLIASSNTPCQPYTIYYPNPCEEPGGGV